MKVPILLPNIFNHPFTYETTLNLKVGNYVVVPFGKSKITGVVWNEFEKKTNKQFSIKKVLSKIEVPALKKNTIEFLNWFAEYNMIPKGMALKLLLLSNNAIGRFPDKNYEKLLDAARGIDDASDESNENSVEDSNSEKISDETTSASNMVDMMLGKQNEKTVDSDTMIQETQKRMNGSQEIIVECLDIPNGSLATKLQPLKVGDFSGNHEKSRKSPDFFRWNPWGRAKNCLKL